MIGSNCGDDWHRLLGCKFCRTSQEHNQLRHFARGDWRNPLITTGATSSAYFGNLLRFFSNHFATELVPPAAALLNSTMNFLFTLPACTSSINCLINACCSITDIFPVESRQAASRSRSSAAGIPYNLSSFRVLSNCGYPLRCADIIQELVCLRIEPKFLPELHRNDVVPRSLHCVATDDSLV